MAVNKEKTKVMVFRKGGPLSKHEKWLYDGIELEVVNRYCYLGYVFSTCLSSKQGTNHLVSKGKNALFFLCRAFQKCREMSRDVYFQVFDTKVKPILLYASEIWGLHILEHIERVHLLACKRYLGVPVCTPNRMVYGELGRYPLFVDAYVRCLKYWFRLLQMDPSRLPNQAYRMLLNVDANENDCWATNVRDILCKTGFHFVWLQQGVGNVNAFILMFKQRIVDMFCQEWSAALGNSNRYDTYTSFKRLFEVEKYLSYLDIHCFRVMLTQLRLGVFPINNNLHRYSDNPEKK